MATLKGLSRSKRSEALSKGVVVDTVRGVLRVRKWPRKRGTPKSALQRWWIDWFKQANKLAKYADGYSQARAIEITKDSGMYPRDVLLAAMRGRLYIWQDQTGKVWYPMAAIQDISESLDVLAQSVGDVLVRAADRWRSPDPGNVGDVLTNQGAVDPPIWSPPSAGGLVQVELVNSPISPGGTVSEYIFDVTNYTELQLVADNVGFAASAQFYIQVSMDGGSTYKAGTDYRLITLTASAEYSGDVSRLNWSDTSGTSGHNGTMKMSNIQGGQFVVDGVMSRSTSVRRCMGYCNVLGPVTHIKLRSNTGTNINGGVIRVFGYQK